MGMIIIYKNKKVEKDFSSKYKKLWKYPSEVKRKLEAIENLIKSSNSFKDLANYPTLHLERLKGNRKNEWSIRVGNTGYRITLIPCDDEQNELIDGDILNRCEFIKIVKIMEVSKHYGQ